MFEWIRRKVRNAVLAGFADAAAELDSQHAPDDADRLLADRVRLLPAPLDEKPVKRGKVG